MGKLKLGGCCDSTCSAKVAIAGESILHLASAMYRYSISWPAMVETTHVGVAGTPTEYVLNVNEVAVMLTGTPLHARNQFPKPSECIRLLESGGTVVVITDLAHSFQNSQKLFVDPFNDFMIGLGSDIRQQIGSTNSSSAGELAVRTGSHRLDTNVNNWVVAASGKITAGSADVLFTDNGWPVVAIEQIHDGTLVVIADDTALRNNRNHLYGGSDSDQFFANIYWDAAGNKDVAGNCATRCDVVGYWNDWNRDNWNLYFPGGYTFQQINDADGFETESMGTVMMGFSENNGSFSVPADAEASLAFLAQGGSIFIVAEYTGGGSPLTANDVLACNNYLQSLGCDLRWETGSRNDAPRNVFPVTLSALNAGMPLTNGRDIIFAGDLYGRVTLGGQESTASHLVDTAGGPSFGWQPVNGGRVFLCANHAFFSGRAVGSGLEYHHGGNDYRLGNWRLFRNIITTAQCGLNT